MRALRSIFAISLLLALAGCGHTSNCAGWKELEPSRADKLTLGTKKQIVSHNDYGSRQGCW